jgi:hypothetical protein
MLGGIFLEGLGDKEKFVPGHAIRNDEYATVWTEFVKELNRKSNKIVPVSGYNRSSFCGRILQLLSV